MKIRLEEKADYSITENLVREAFWNLYRPGCDEHFIVYKMRGHSDFIPELAFVIEDKEQIVGCIYYTHSKVVDKDGNEHKTITFGPVAVLPKLQRQGIGRRLITHSIKKAQEMGFSAIVIGGYPYHYRTYGFVGTKRYGITMPDGNFYKGIMALPLYEQALRGVSGSVYFSDVFDTEKTQVDEFDKLFAPKERCVQDSQREFEIASGELE